MSTTSLDSARGNVGLDRRLGKMARVAFLDDRWTWFSHASIESERRLGWPERVPKIADEGWSRFAERAPADSPASSTTSVTT